MARNQFDSSAGNPFTCESSKTSLSAHEMIEAAMSDLSSASLHHLSAAQKANRMDALREDCRVAEMTAAKLRDEARRERSKDRNASRLQNQSVNEALKGGVGSAATEAFTKQRVREVEMEIASWVPLESSTSDAPGACLLCCGHP